MANAEILIIKVGQVQQLTFADGSIYESAIRKQPVDTVNIHALGAEGNDVGLKAHHGGRSSMAVQIAVSPSGS